VFALDTLEVPVHVEQTCTVLLLKCGVDVCPGLAVGRGLYFLTLGVVQSTRFDDGAVMDNRTRVDHILGVFVAGCTQRRRISVFGHGAPGEVEVYVDFVDQQRAVVYVVEIGLIRGAAECDSGGLEAAIAEVVACRTRVGAVSCAKVPSDVHEDGVDVGVAQAADFRLGGHLSAVAVGTLGGELHGFD